MVSRLRKVSRAGSDAGITLAELIIVMLLMSLLGVVIVTLFTSTMKATTMATSLSTNTKQATNAMNETARLIRAGTANPVKGNPQSDPAFVVAKPEEIIMYAYVNLSNTSQTPIMVRLYLDSERRLVEQRWPATQETDGYWKFPPATPATASSTRILANTVAAGVPPFRYLNSDGTTLNVTTPTTGLTIEQRRVVAAVTVSLKVQQSLTNGSLPVELLNTVGIPNLGFHREVL
jgi:type II secretory pathway pseudopilin PulG